MRSKIPLMAGLVVLVCTVARAQESQTQTETAEQRRARILAQQEATIARMRSNMVVLQAQMAASRSNRLAAGGTNGAVSTNLLVVTSTNAPQRKKSPLYVNPDFLAAHPEMSMEDIYAGLQGMLGGPEMTREQKQAMRPKWDAELHELQRTNGVVIVTNWDDLNGRAGNKPTNQSR